MSKWERTLQITAFILIIVSIIARSILDTSDTGILVTLSFVAIVFYFILLLCAFFPADWRMTDKQRNQIKDMDAYQTKYRKFWVIVNFIASIVTGILIFVMG